jgi:hypothetical protein
MKHGFVQEMETIIDSDLKIKHDDLAAKVLPVSSLINMLILPYS